MTMAAIEVGGSRRLDLELTRNPVRLYPAAAGAQLELAIRAIDAGQPIDGENFMLAATVYVSDSRQNRRALCRVRAGHHSSPTQRGVEVRLKGVITDQQLRVIEEMRRGGDLWLHLEFEVVGVLAVPSGPHVWLGQLTFQVGGGEWADQLERVDAGSFVDVLVGMPDTDESASAVRRLREARQHLRAGEILAALGAARLALDPVLASVREGGVSKNAQNKSPRDRDLPERFAVLVEAAYSALSGAAHDDEVTKAFRYTWPEAEALIATTAGLVKRSAESRL